MSFGLDFVTAPTIAAMKSASVAFVCRYLSEVNDLTKIKLLTAAEAKADSAAGIAIVSNYEWYGNRAAEGFNSGVADAKIAAAQHAACGGPGDRPIYFSVDFNTSATAAIIDYFHGVASVIGLARTGAYGGYACIKGLLDAGAIKWAWQTYAWSGGQWDARAHILQYENGIAFDGRSVDYDRSVKPDFGQWFYGGAMQLYTKDSADFGQWFTYQDDNHWLCKETNVTLQYAILHFFEKLSIDGHHLPIVGLPRTNEIYLTINGKQIVLVICERAAIWYDANHVKGTQPGTDDICQLAFLTDPDMLAHVPGLTQPTAPVDTTALLAAINAIPDAIAPAVAQALVEAKKL